MQITIEARLSFALASRRWFLRSPLFPLSPLTSPCRPAFAFSPLFFISRPAAAEKRRDDVQSLSRTSTSPRRFAKGNRGNERETERYTCISLSPHLLFPYYVDPRRTRVVNLRDSARRRERKNSGRNACTRAYTCSAK